MNPLEGILVVAVEQAVAAPLCTARLHAAGARVVKIERPGGDFARQYDTAARGESSYFVWINQGKQSVVLDFKQPNDHALLTNLIANADIFIQNLAPGALERAGFGSSHLRKKHPKLITCDISGYGESEEMAHMKAYDFLVQAETGLVEISGGPGEPGRIGVSVCDIGTGLSAHAAIMEALFLRERTGEGSGLKISLFDTAAEWMSVPLIHNDYGDGPPSRQGLHHPSIAPYGGYQTREGSTTILSIQNEREWLSFCETVLEKKAIATHSDFATNNARVANRQKLDAIINDKVSNLTAEHFLQRLTKANIACACVNSVAQLSQHKALSRINVKTSDGKNLTIPAPPAFWDNRPEYKGDGTPKLGQHTELIRREFNPDKRKS